MPGAAEMLLLQTAVAAERARGGLGSTPQRSRRGSWRRRRHTRQLPNTRSIAFITAGKRAAGTEMGIDGLKTAHVVAGRKGEILDQRMRFFSQLAAAGSSALHPWKQPARELAGVCFTGICMCATVLSSNAA